MKLNCRQRIKRWMAVLLAVMLVSGNITPVVYANTGDSLKPADVTDETGNVVLHKQAERIGPDEWEINVKATINESPVEVPKLEVAFVLDASNSMYSCAEEELHNNHFKHRHTFNQNLSQDYLPSCELICGNSSHTHVDACYNCGLTYQDHRENNGCRYNNEMGELVGYESRFSIAKKLISKMEESLPEGTSIAKVGFNLKDFPFYTTDNYETEEPSGSKVYLYGATYMMSGVKLALNTENKNCCFTDDSTAKKILVIVTDGKATDGDYGNPDNPDNKPFIDFVENDGIVYTIGFNHDDPNLEGMVANGGTYSQASNPDELEQIFDKISVELTAMLVDPMGSSVGFETGSVEPGVGALDGNINYDESSKTLYWNPSGTDDISKSSIEYTYKVKLNEDADMNAGVHSGIPLNKTTSLLYGINGLDGTTMKSTDFPIPHATYEISTMQVNWKAGDTDLQESTATERVICDYPGAVFETDYTTIIPEFTYNNQTFYYDKTVITKDGQEVSDVTITDAAEFVVTHQYSLEKKYNVEYEYTGDVPEGAPDASSYNQSGISAGDLVTVADNPQLEGYEFSGWAVVEGNATIENGSFTMPENDVKLQGSWKEISKATAVVRFVDGEGIALQADMASEEIYVGNAYDVSEAEAVETIVVDGVIYDFISDDDASYVGTMLEGGIEITRIYHERGKAKVVVHFVDDKEQTLQDDVASEAIYIGANYDVSEAKDVKTIEKDGKIYDFVSDKNAEYAGKMSPNGVEITRVYKERAKAAAVVHFVDEAGNSLREDVSSEEIYVGSEYDVSDTELYRTIGFERRIYDFTYDNKVEYTGTMPAGGVVIIRVYKERAKAKTVVHFVDEDGNKLQDDISSGEIYIGTNYDVSGVTTRNTFEVNGVVYDFVRDDGKAYNGMMPEGGVEITRVYTERGKAEVIVHFVDEDGNKLQADVTSGAVYIDKEYDVSDADKISSITKDGKVYDFSGSTPGSYKGRMPKDGLEISRVYKERAKATAIVHYVDEADNPLQADTTQTVYIDSNYDVSEAEDVITITVDDVIYDFANDGEAVYIGEMTANGVEITRVYKAKEFYYQIKTVYTGYDADGKVIYNETKEEAVQGTFNQTHTVFVEETCEYEGYAFNRKGDGELTADLSNTTVESPYIFVIEYEFNVAPQTPEDPDDPSEGPEEPVVPEDPDNPSDGPEEPGDPSDVPEEPETPDEDLDNPPEENDDNANLPDDESISETNDNPEQDEEEELPETSDEGPERWMGLLLLASAALFVLQRAERRNVR